MAIVTRDSLEAMITRANDAKKQAIIGRALQHLTERQTVAEQAMEATVNDNGIGFTPADARMGTSMAGFYTKRGYLSPKQIAYWIRPNAKGVMRVAKYHKQLNEVATAKRQAA